MYALGKRRRREELGGRLRRNPDAGELAADSAFASWVGQSPGRSDGMPPTPRLFGIGGSDPSPNDLPAGLAGAAPGASAGVPGAAGPPEAAGAGAGLLSSQPVRAIGAANRKRPQARRNRILLMDSLKSCDNASHAWRADHERRAFGPGILSGRSVLTTGRATNGC